MHEQVTMLYHLSKFTKSHILLAGEGAVLLAPMAWLQLRSSAAKMSDSGTIPCDLVDNLIQAVEEHACWLHIDDSMAASLSRHSKSIEMCTDFNQGHAATFVKLGGAQVVYLLGAQYKQIPQRHVTICNCALCSTCGNRPRPWSAVSTTATCTEGLHHIGYKVTMLVMQDMEDVAESHTAMSWTHQ